MKVMIEGKIYDGNKHGITLLFENDQELQKHVENMAKMPLQPGARRAYAEFPGRWLFGRKGEKIQEDARYWIKTGEEKQYVFTKEEHKRQVSEELPKPMPISIKTPNPMPPYQITIAIVLLLLSAIGMAFILTNEIVNNHKHWHSIVFLVLLSAFILSLGKILKYLNNEN